MDLPQLPLSLSQIIYNNLHLFYIHNITFFYILYRERHRFPFAESYVFLVRIRGLEPPWSYPHTDLNRARLPIPPYPHNAFRTTNWLYPIAFATSAAPFRGVLWWNNLRMLRKTIRGYYSIADSFCKDTHLKFPLNWKSKFHYGILLFFRLTLTSINFHYVREVAVESVPDFKQNIRGDTPTFAEFG